MYLHPYEEENKKLIIDFNKWQDKLIFTIMFYLTFIGFIITAGRLIDFLAGITK